jgi:predicted small lipoprotein YifL
VDKRVLLAALALALGACGDGVPTGAPPAAQASPTAGMSPELARQYAEEQKAMKEAMAKVAQDDAASAARTKSQIAGLTEASQVLGADPIPALRGRVEACMSGDRQAFASFYTPELVAIYSSTPQALDFEFRHTCGDNPQRSSKAQMDAMVGRLQLYARRSPSSDRLSSYPMYELCATDTGPQRCAGDSPWDNHVEVRDGRVVFVTH